MAEPKEGGRLRPQTEAWASKHLDDIVEQDRRRVKQRTRPMPGSERLGDAAVMIGGVEPAQQIRKGQFDTPAVAMRDGASARRMWEAVLAA